MFHAPDIYEKDQYEKNLVFLIKNFKEGPRFAQFGSEDMKKKFVFYVCQYTCEL